MKLVIGLCFLILAGTSAQTLQITPQGDEFTKPLGTRLPDGEWKGMLDLGNESAFEASKESFMVPATAE